MEMGGGMRRSMELEGGRRRSSRPGRALSRHSTAWALAALLLCAPPLVPAARAESNSLAYEGVLGLGSAIASLVYSPLKIVYAVGGTALSAVTLVWTFDTSIAGPIFSQTVGGDYVVVPAHLQGRRKLEFLGPR